MSLEFAVERLLDVGWTPGASRLLQRLPDGREYPEAGEVAREFAEAGLKLKVRQVALFSCYRAEWANAEGRVVGYCVGATEAEAAVYALAQLLASRQELAAV